MKQGMTYKKAGVDIEEGDRLVDRIKPLAQSTRRPEVLEGIGGFGALFRLNRPKMKDPVLVSGTDGVGTKLKIAFALNRHDTVGIDLVAMCVNDILTLGAEPLFFLDYFATGRLRSREAASVVSGIARGCRESGAALIGGETAELPGFYAKGEYDLAGFAVGVVDRGHIIDGRTIRAGDVLVALPSSGLHSNGYSLARKVLLDAPGMGPRKRLKEIGQPVGEALLTPTRIYVRPVLAVLKRYPVKGMAHITGGGLTENLPRVLPKGMGIRIRRSSWTPPPLFQVLQDRGRIEEPEMYRTFNMGIGFVVIVAPEWVNRILAAFRRQGEEPFVIGSVEKRTRSGVVYG